MSEIINQYLPWLLSAITIWMTVLAGNKHQSAWLVGIVNQALWLIWILMTSSWGFLPMNAVLWVVYSRNHLRWTSEQGTVVALDKRVSLKNPQHESVVEALRSNPATQMIGKAIQQQRRIVGNIPMSECE